MEALYVVGFLLCIVLVLIIRKYISYHKNLGIIQEERESTITVMCDNDSHSCVIGDVAEEIHIPQEYLKQQLQKYEAIECSDLDVNAEVKYAADQIIVELHSGNIIIRSDIVKKLFTDEMLRDTNHMSKILIDGDRNPADSINYSFLDQAIDELSKTDKIVVYIWYGLLCIEYEQNRNQSTTIDNVVSIKA